MENIDRSFIVPDLEAGKQYTAVYVRVSTTEQGLSLDAQESACRAYCMAKGLNDEVAIYADFGYSGKNGRRPAFVSLQSDIKTGQIKRVVSQRFDRIGRSLAHFMSFTELANRLDVPVAVLDIDLDTGSPVGKAVARILATVAELESDLISERTKTAMRHAQKSRGVRYGAPKYGHSADERANIVLVQKMTAQGMTQIEIIRELRSLGITSRSKQPASYDFVRTLQRADIKQLLSTYA